MHLKELNHRSPLRVFERSVHGGLGRGNLGVVAARPGVGKSAFLTCLALDELLRDRRVLHVTTTGTVEHVRNYYEEIFSDLARAANLDETLVARDKVEHNRIIQRVTGQAGFATSLARAVALLGAHVSFQPDLVVVEGFDFQDAGDGEVRRLREVAREVNAELWMSMSVPVPAARSDRMREDWHDVPEPVGRLGDLVSVVVYLHAVQDAVRIRLLKDHDNTDVAELTLDLDATTLLVKER